VIVAKNYDEERTAVIKDKQTASERNSLLEKYKEINFH
jgi:hypothetical protein